MVRLILEENNELARQCIIIWNGQDGFEIKQKELRFVVNNTFKTCTCRLWKLRGVPCEHAVYIYYCLQQDPDEHVKHWYRKDKFLQAYEHFIQPIPNLEM